MAVTKFKSRVSDKKIYNSKFCLVKLELVEPNRIAFGAGQYLIMDVPGIEQKRNYSIASIPEMNHAVELLVDVSPAGSGSDYLKGLKPGDEVNFMAPAGKFVIEESKAEEKLVFVATGSGIAPIRGIILDLLETKKDGREIWLHWGVRYAQDLFWEEDFAQLAEEFENFHVDIVLSEPMKEWKLCTGRVTDCLRGHERDFAKTGFYLCGSREMIEEVRGLLSEREVDESMIHREEFY